MKPSISTVVHILMKPIPLYSCTILMKPHYHSTVVHILMKPIPLVQCTHTNEAFTIVYSCTHTNEALH